MAVLAPDTVAVIRCEDCTRPRTIATERDRAVDDRLRVTVLDGCDQCAGSTLVL